MTRGGALAHTAHRAVTRALVLVCLSAASGGHALAEDYKVGSVVVAQPWARATPPGAKVAGGYLTITNDGDEVDRLVSATAEIAGRAELHQMTVVDGVMTMRPLAEGVEVPAGGSVALKPGSYHLMLMELAGPLKNGDSFTGTLTFEKAGTVEVTFAVGPIGSARAPMHGHHHMEEGSKHEHGEPAN